MRRIIYRRGTSCGSVYRIQDIVWFIIGIIQTLLVLRFIFLAFSARSVSITGLIYSLSEPFVAPFAGIFGILNSRIGFIDLSTLVAIFMYIVIGWILEALISILFSPRNIRC